MGRFSAFTKRKLVQCTAALLSNANLRGFATGRIYQGKAKWICVPGLNCYSCPAAVGACPLGALQTMLADPQYKMSFYVLGMLAAFGLVLGRAVCGWLCPFGLLQELWRGLWVRWGKPVKRIWAGNRRAAEAGSMGVEGGHGAAVGPDKHEGAGDTTGSGNAGDMAGDRRTSGDRPARGFEKRLRHIKYIFLGVFVVLMPLFAVDAFGFGAPYFCELICPAGMLEGALPILVKNPGLFRLAGWVFWLKAGIVVVFLAGAAMNTRFFCKYLCPLGAIYGLFHRISLVQLRFDAVSCVGCGTCEKVCPMDIDPRKPEWRGECIRCGKCAGRCPGGALRLTPSHPLLESSCEQNHHRIAPPTKPCAKLR
ncbi:MAG: 4Fe-4S binding protein [Lachnospiraceae bacterium]|jgi:ferredoxin|nr:4Fe-4S binding protein [Lachnospiraceae bacterium]